MERQPSVYQSGSGPRDSNAPVLRRRNSDANASSDDNVYSPRPTTQTARNTPNDDVPVMRRRESSGSDVNDNPQPASTTSNTTQRAGTDTGNTTTTNTSTDVNTPSATQWGFSARDKRVINSCLADNPGSVPAADANAIPYYKGDTLPYAAQKKIRSLPLACERQLSSVAGDQERVIYNQQVLLINSNSLVLDSFDVPKQ
jgi:hypothetical protein